MQDRPLFSAVPSKLVNWQSPNRWSCACETCLYRDLEAGLAGGRCDGAPAAARPAPRPPRRCRSKVVAQGTQQPPARHLPQRSGIGGARAGDVTAGSAGTERLGAELALELHETPDLGAVGHRTNEDESPLCMVWVPE